MSENFEQLLSELNQAAEEQGTLAKSMAAADADDKAVQEAAKKDGENPEDDEGENLAKSDAANGAEGEEPILIDGDEIIKSLGMMDGRMTAAEETLTKGLTTALDLIKGQSELIKSMQSRMDKLAGQGAGRKTVLQVHEKPAVGEHLAKSQPEGVSREEVMAKATAAWEAKKITGHELTTIDVSLRNNQAPSAAVLAKILS